MNTLTKGNRWSRRVRLWLEGMGFVTSRRGIGEAGDDIDAVRPGLHLSVEAKNHKTITLAAFVDQAEGNAGDRLPIVVVHRKGRAEPEDGYVVMSGRTFSRFLGSGP